MPAMKSASILMMLGGAALAGIACVAQADVTVEQKTSMDLAFIKMHITRSEAISGMKKREDSNASCEGFMSFFCRKASSGEIVRLDKDMIYDLEPAKNSYREHALPTAAERQEMQRRMQEAMQKMKQCAAQQPQHAAVDTSKCKMSPAKLDVKNLGAAGQILGHNVHHTSLTLTSTCTNEQTGDACDMQFGMDSWLTDDEVAGLADERAFSRAYMEKMGLTGEGMASMAKQMQQFLAPYADQMKELQAKSSDLKGHPLRSEFRVSFGGEKCAAARNNGGNPASGGGSGSNTGVNSGEVTDAVANSTAEVAASKAADGSVGGTIASRTLSSVGGKLLSGLFRKKAHADEEAKAPASTGQVAPAATPPGMATILSMTTETTAITPGSVPADRFEIPAGWKKIVPPPSRAGNEEFTCPKAGSGD